MSQDLRTFAQKCALVGATAVISTYLIIQFTHSAVEDLATRVADETAQRTIRTFRDNFSTASLLNSFIDQADKFLEAQADPQRELPPEKRERMMKNLKIVSDRWRPFVQRAAGQ